MRTFARLLTVFAFAVLLSWILPACQDKPPEDHEQIVRAGLTEILSHQESSCNEVISWKLDKRLDYLVSCENGMQFRIHVGKEGHVNVEGHQ